MERATLEKILKLTSPAISSKGHIPIFSHYCFDGESVTGYNDTLCIQFNFNSGVNGAIRGDLLQGLVQGSDEKEIKFKQTENNIEATLGKTKSKLPFLPEEDFLHTDLFEEDLELVEVKLNEDFLNGLKKCLPTVSNDTARPAMMGVTLKLTNNSNYLYSTDTNSISRYKLNTSSEKEGEVIMPTEFCLSLISMKDYFEEEDDIELLISPTFTFAEFSDGSFILGRLIDSQDGIDIQQVIDDSYDSEELTQEIPEAFDTCLERSFLFNKVGKGPGVSLKVEKGKLLHLETITDLGEVKDVVKLKEKTPDIEVLCSPEFLLRGSSLCDAISIQNMCVVFKENDNYLHLVANKE